jgi:hypothetical protein
MANINKIEFNAFGKNYKIDFTRYVRRGSDANGDYIYLREKSYINDLVGDVRMNVTDPNQQPYIQTCWSDGQNGKNSGTWYPNRELYDNQSVYDDFSYDLTGNYLYNRIDLNYYSSEGNLTLTVNPGVFIAETVYRFTFVPQGTSVYITINDIYNLCHNVRNIYVQNRQILQIEVKMSQGFLTAIGTLLNI